MQSAVLVESAKSNSIKAMEDAVRMPMQNGNEDEDAAESVAENAKAECH